MSKRDRQLKQRLDELFSTAAEPAEAPPETLSAKPADVTSPIESAATPAADLAYLKAMVEQLPVPAYLKDREHTWVAMNAAFGRLIGYAPDTLLGHTDKEQADEAWQVDDRVLDTGQLEDIQENISLPDGTPALRRIRRTPLLNQQREVQYVMGVVQEEKTVLPGKQTEAELRKFKLGLDRSTAAIFITDRSGVITYVNPAFETIYGFTREEAIGQTPRIIKSGLIPPEQYQRFWAALLAGQTVAGEIINKAKDGQLISIEGSNSAILDEHGEITGFLALHQDITQRKQAENDLVIRNKQLAALNRLARELAQLATPQEVAEHAFIIIGDVLDNRNLSIAFYDDRQQEISFPVYTIEGERRAVASRPFGNGITEYILRTRKPLLIPRAVQESAASLGIISIGRPSQCFLGVPMLAGDKAIGVVAVQDYEREEVYSTSDVELLNAMAAQMTAALENVRLHAAETRRALQLQTAAEISTAASTMLNIDELLPYVVDVIQQRFNLYYSGLFLLDATRRNAILRAGTGETGRLMLERHHQLVVDDHSMIGWCIRHQTPRVALDVGHEAVRFNNPLLPDTHSESALPLISRGDVLGAITVQSTETAAFSEQDIAILQTMSDQVATAIANAQLFDQARLARQQAEVRLRETQFLRNVGQAVSSSLDLSHVMDVVLETLQSEFDFTHIALTLMDQTGGTVTIPRASGTASQLQGLTRSIAQLQNDIVMDILRKGRTEVIDGWDDRLDREIYESQGHAALVRAFVPLRLRGESIGLLEVGYRRVERARITPEEVRLLDGLADQIAMAVGNARLFDESQQRITELAVVNEVGQALMATQDIQQLFATIHQQVGRLLGASNFYIATYSGGEDWLLEYQVEHGQRQPATRHKLGGGFTSYILQARQAILTRSLQENIDFHDQHGLPKIGETAKSWMGVPLLVGGNVIGAMAVQSYEQEGLYTEHDMALFSTIGTQVAATIQNARLFQEARLRAAELAALNELSQTLAAQLDVNQVLHEVWQGVSRLLDTTNFYIALYDREREEVSFPINASESVLDKEIEVMPADQGLTGYIIRTREPLLITEDTDQRVKQLGLESVGGSSQSYLGVPLMLGEQVLGVMAIQSYTTTRLYNEHDQDLMLAIAGQAAIALQNARLFERTQRNTRELTALNELGQVIAQQIEIAQILEATYRRLASLTVVDAFFAVLYDRESNTMSFPLVYDEGQRYLEPSGPLNPESSTGQVIATGEPILTLLTPDELASTTEVTGALGNVNKPSASLLYVPLKVGPQTIGVLSVQSYQANAYNRDTVQLMVNVANQVAIAIQNARLFSEARQRSAELATLNQIVSSVTETLDLRTLLGTVLKQTLEFFGFDGGLITMFNEGRQKLERIVRTGLPGRIPDDPAEGLENSLCAYVFNSKEPLVIEDFREGAPLDVRGEIEAGYYSYIGLPLEARGHMLGTWCGFRKFAGPFDKNTLPLLQAVGRQLGFAIENVRLFEQTQRAAQREQTLREITSRVRSSTDPDTIARAAVRELGLALGRQTFIRLGDAEQLRQPPTHDQKEVPAPGNGRQTSLEGGQ